MHAGKLFSKVIIGCSFSFLLLANEAAIEEPQPLSASPQEADLSSENTSEGLHLAVEEAPEQSSNTPKEEVAPLPEAAPKTVVADAMDPPLQWNPPENCAKDAPNTLSFAKGKKFQIQSTHINNIEPKKSLFFQSNVGVGFLYFSGYTGNLMINPPALVTSRGAMTSSPIKGRLSYNRTPLYESVIGWKLLPWLRMGLSYQYQGGISVQTPLLAAAGIRPQFSADLSLNGISLRNYFELPYPFIWGKFSASPYLGLGFGVGWQSWTREQVVLFLADKFSVYRGDVDYLSNTYCANAIWMFDLGFRMQRANPYNPFSMTMGVKYNQWGQARNLGMLRKQGENKFGLFKPIRIRTLYQWAPYIGVQWNFSPVWTSKSPYTIQNKLANTWKPFLVNLNQIEGKGSILTQFNVGVGFLYMKKVMGLMRNNSVYDTNFRANYQEITQPLSYNRTPLFEYLIGYRALSWFRPYLSYQYQTGINVQTPRIISNRRGLAYLGLVANLNLSAVMLKTYFELPYPMIWKNTAFSAYTGVGLGPSWQSWTRIDFVMTQVPTGGGFFYQGYNIPLREKISANAALCVDMGMRIQSAFPNSPYNVTMGCKYNYWGQARNIGLWTQQGALKVSNQLFSIRSIHQFAPYLGFQWSFLPSCVEHSPYTIEGKRVNVWRPFFTNQSNLQPRNWKWVQFNVGIGFLYFSKIRGNLMRTPPGTAQSANAFTTVPFKYGLTYNRTPLFEYLIGATLYPCLKLALSFQHQGSVTVQSDVLPGYATPTALRRNPRARFTSDLALDAIMMKVYTQLPAAMIWRSLSMTPYLALGVGPSWQSWLHPYIFYSTQAQNGTAIVTQQNLRQEISANCAWMFDIGINTSAARPDSAFGLWTGIKYNQWGQARNIAAKKKHGYYDSSLFKPISIKTVYQWAPYIGVQWNF